MGPQTSASTQCIRWEKLDKVLQDAEVTLSPFYTHRSWGSNRSSRSKVRKPKKSWLETSIWTSYFLHWTRRWALALDTLKLGLASHKAWPRVSHGSTELGKVHGQSWPRKALDNTQTQQWPHLRALVLGALPDGKQCVDSSWHVDWRWFWQPRAAGFPWAKACWAQFTREAIANGQGDLAFHPCSFNPLRAECSTAETAELAETGGGAKGERGWWRNSLVGFRVYAMGKAGLGSTMDSLYHLGQITSPLGKISSIFKWWGKTENIYKIHFRIKF